MTDPLLPPTRRANPAALLVLSLSLLLSAGALVVVLATSTGRTGGTSPGTATPDLIDRAGTVIDPPQPLTDFRFAASTGGSLSLSDLRGQYVLLYFGFTRCPDFCPTTLIKYKQIKALLGEAADQVTFVMVSVDEERDTPPVLEQYMGRFDPAFIGLQGTDTALELIQSEYNLFYARVPLAGSASDYTMDHSASKYLINPDGQLIRIYSFTDQAAVIAEDIQSLLGEAPAP